MSRKRFSEREVIQTLIIQGFELRCYRCKWRFTTDDEIEREHVHELALGGEDTPRNCAYSHKACHAIVTNGTPATTAGSSKNRIAKSRGTRAEKFAVKKLRIDKPREEKRRFGTTFARNR